MTQVACNAPSTPVAYILGLDIGVASVGWCLLGSNRIIDLGVRAFDKAETPDKGESLNKTRRDARLLRRRLHRRAWRLTKLARLLKREGLIDHIAVLKRPPSKGFKTPNLWRLRVEALDRPLSGEEWARVLYHLCKHRGFHWYSKAEQAKGEGESGASGGSVKQGLLQNAARMKDKNYRTAAEMVLAEFPDAQRNKQSHYDKALSRVLLDEELGKLFVAQREHGNPFAHAELERHIRGPGDQRNGLFWKQEPALTGSRLLNMLGHCTFETQEYRAPKASFSAERHVWLTRLVNLRIVVDGIARPLNDEERQFALLLPYRQSRSATKFSYADLRKKLTGEFPRLEGFRFLGLPGARRKKSGEVSDPESEALVRIPAWQELRKTLEDAGLTTEWKQLASDALEGRPEILDGITCVLSVYKDDDEARAELTKLNLPHSEKMIEVLLSIRFDKFSNLSLKALRRIIPLMEQGLRYDEAVAQIPEYGHHSQIVRSPKKSHYLPSFYEYGSGSAKLKDDPSLPRNPVVLRALNQARKVVNAIIAEYGSPAEVHIEMARDLSRPLDERRDIERQQQEYRDRNDAARLRFTELFQRIPNGRDFEKWLLYGEQQGKCAYCLSPLANGSDASSIFTDNRTQVDHVLPYSRSFDDSRNNKVLVHTKCNQEKGNRTPYELLDGQSDSAQWHNFVAWVGGNKSYRLAKRNRLLRKNYGREEAQGFKDRNLNDTRYICKFFKQYVEDNLALSSESKRCVVLSGQLTALLRRRWGLTKSRDSSDRHHALDAAVVAACSHAMVKRMSDYARRKELEHIGQGFVDAETGEVVDINALRRLEAHFPRPWDGFDDELCLRAGIDRSTGRVLEDTSVEALREGLRRFRDANDQPRYLDEDLKHVRPLFVSRAPQRRNSGAIHKDTIYSARATKELPNRVTQRISLERLTLKTLGGDEYDPEKCELFEPHRNERLYRALHARLRAHEGKADRAFAEPFHKPTNSGEQGPIVRSVQLVINKLSGMPLRGGIAMNDSMIRVDVFRQADKFHLVPIYARQRSQKGLPNRAIVAYKDEEEWTIVDDKNFLFSLYPCDLICVKVKNITHLGYFTGCNRSTGAINILVHDRDAAQGKNGQIQSIGVKTAIDVERLNVDILGRIYLARAGRRHGLA